MSKPLVLELKEKVEGTILYENIEGQSTDFPIDPKFDLNNYNRLDMVVGRSQGGVGGVVITVDLTIYRQLSNPAIPLAFIDTDGGNSFAYETRIKINDNNIVFNNNARLTFGGNRDTSLGLAIYKIIGYEN